LAKAASASSILSAAFCLQETKDIAKKATSKMLNFVFIFSIDLVIH